MTLEQAIAQACNGAGVIPPRGAIAMRKWVPADTLGKNGKGDGRIMCDEERVTVVNWQTGDKVTVWLKEERTVEDRRRYAAMRREDDRRAQEKAARAGRIAASIVAVAAPASHPYTVNKGFPNERPLVVAADDVRRLAGFTDRDGNFVPAEYLVPDGGKTAIVIPARIGARVSSVQLIWADGTKKFLAGGDLQGAFHRISSGTATWLCEGYATGLSLRAALKGLSRSDTVLVCFTASNIAKVAQSVRGRCFIAADHDAPPKAKPEQFGGLGAGEYFARKAGKPYVMPEVVGTDVNDLHRASGVFAVQRLINGFLRGVPP